VVPVSALGLVPLNRLLKSKLNVPADAEPAVKAKVVAAIAAPPTRDKRLIELVLVFNPLNILVAPLFVFLNSAYVLKYIFNLFF
jgi:hypothetical protein